ncbi:hypothetical protein N0B16_01260 [Chryseobacterium sp. GMJ5]|uniref:Lipoprotein n=1 Tax=Chryseobacterium gilvum TaxID=2976534 RepID=A0ABT2VSU1_9FLAO|nr:hypothetical protein [Chryseobacterium gilvum]MCU7613057.1 hypothetical protein [Chryseobacterium gilvum]
MKHIHHIFSGVFLLFILNVSCKEHAVKASAAPFTEDKIPNDTVIATSGIYLVSPDEKEINSLKKSMGEENFYTAADDSNFYISKISSRVKERLVPVKFQNINFKDEQFVFDKKAQKNAWLIIDYNKGNKPQTYSLTDFYSRLDQKNNISEKNNSGIDEYAQNNEFTSFTFDINGDGKEDQIFSSKRNMGDRLVVFLSNRNGYSEQLQSTNFSQDGGNQVSKIMKNGNGFTIETNFPQGTDKYTYFVNYENSHFMVNKVVHEISSWQQKNETVKVCEFNPHLTLQQDSDEVFNTLIEAEKKAKCVTKKAY